MKSQVRDVIAIGVSVAAIAIGSLAALGGQIQPGLELERRPDGTVLVSAVTRFAQAYRDGIAVGMHVDYIADPDEAGNPPPGASAPTGNLVPAPEGTYWLSDGLAPPTRVVYISVSDRFDGRLDDAGGIAAWALIALALGIWLRLRPSLVPAADTDLIRRLALPVTAVLATTLALVPAALAGTSLGLWSLVPLPAIAAGTLVDSAAPLTRVRARPIAIALLLLASISWLAGLAFGDPYAAIGPNLCLSAVFTAVFIAISADILGPEPPIGSDFEGRLRGAVRTFDLMLVLGGVISGVVALGLSTASPGDWANVAKVWLVFVVLRLAVVPFIVTARRARVSRDLTLDAVEAERVRISGEIHDDVIQDLTMLVRRLDASTDHESAAIAREAAGRLREITGDARLPVLDDLGVAAALDWLVQRMRSIDDGTLSLTTDEVTRPPRAVEVAVFRIAQEALANAMRHGAAPVSIEYRSATDAVSLDIADSGPGIAVHAEEIADGAGRLGIAGMRRRAAAIGATLQIDRLAAGGTRVHLDWRAT